MSDTPRRGRPAGLLLNPDAARFALGTRSQSWLAATAELSTAHLSEMMAGTKGATPAIAERIAVALDVPVGMLFPELVQFSTTIRHFTAPKIEAA